MSKPRILGMPSAYQRIRQNERYLNKAQRTALYGQVKGGQTAEAMKGLSKILEANHGKR